MSGESVNGVEVRKDTSRRRRLVLRWIPFGVWVGLFGFVPYAGRFPTGDSPHILGICMRLGWYLREGSAVQFVARWLELLAPHPPGAYVLPALAYGLFGNRYWVPWLCGALLLAVIWDGILRMLDAMGTRGAWGVALALAAAPLVWSQAEVYGIDLASAAAVTQCLSHLMASRGLTRRRPAVLAGLWLGIGFWTKYTFPVFLFVPCVAILVGLLWDWARGFGGIPARVRNGVALVCASGVPLVPLGLLKGGDILNYVQRSLSPTDEERMLVDALSVPGALDVSRFDRKYLYAAALKDLWGWPGLALLAAGFALLLIGCVGAIRRERTEPAFPLRAAALGLISAVSGILFLSAFAQKADRYMLPAVFPLAAVLMPPLSTRRWSMPLVLAVLLPPCLFVFSDYAGFTQHLSFDDGVRGVELQFHRRGPAPTARRLDHSARKTLTTWGRYPLLEEAYRPYSADPRRWKIDAILEWVSGLDSSGEGDIGVYIAPSLPATHLGMFLMRAEKLGYHRTFVTVKLRAGTLGGVHADLFQAPFMVASEPSFNILVVMDTGDGAGGTDILSRYIEKEGFRERRREDLGHGRIRILTRQ